ncbi:hypothetical protein GGR56DRAFT_119978 [Xylariaceae sp. FL0804]|nr:hypothetical protein GGR56DRAFT_119978 [Xylariaceae sp. FL0804]
MPGTIIITGANGSLAMHAVQELLSRSPDTTLVLTVRDASDSDANTSRLRQLGARFPHPPTIRALDLADLNAVREFADAINRQVAGGEVPPLRGLVCNAYHWNLVADPAATAADGLETAMQVNHVAHAALALRLLRSFDLSSAVGGGGGGGRILTFTSDAAEDGRNGLQRYPPTLPADLDELMRVGPESDRAGRGFQRYAQSKLAILLWTHALNRRLEKDDSLKKITAVCVWPGSLVDSRALRTNTPGYLPWVQRLVLQPLRPLLRLADPHMRTSAAAGVETAQLVMPAGDGGAATPGERGYFEGPKKGVEAGPKDGLDEALQEKVWAKTLEWAKITADDVRVPGLGL